MAIIPEVVPTILNGSLPDFPEKSSILKKTELGRSH
jgi:hypothetical protein